MQKVAPGWATRFVFSPHLHQVRESSKKCQICGNLFLPLSQASRFCEFCKTPFNGMVSETAAPVMFAAG